jgi:hypothetical protein
LGVALIAIALLSVTDYTRRIVMDHPVMDHPDLVNLIRRMKAITAAVRVRIEEIETAKHSPLARKTYHDADLQAIREEGYRIRKAMTALFRTQEHLLKIDRDRWATERTRLNDEIQEKFAAFERAVAEYRRQIGQLPSGSI